MNPSRSIARPFNECIPCLLMLRLVTLTLVAIITSTTLVLTGSSSRDPNSSGLAIPMTFASTEGPSGVRPVENISTCGSAPSGSTALDSPDPGQTGEAFSYDVSVTDRRSAGPCRAETGAGDSGLEGESTGFDRRLPILLTPRAIPR